MTPSNGHQKIGQRVDRINDSAQAFLEETRAVARDFASTVDLHGRVERHPYRMVAGAIGVGYVLGGGLFTPLTGLLLKVASRLVLLPFVKDGLVDILDRSLGQSDPRGIKP